MTEETKVPPVAEAPSKTARETIEDNLTESTEQPTVEADEESTGSDTEETSETKEDADSAESKEDETEESTEEVDEVEDLLKDSSKDNIQKRIDKLVSENKALKERLEKKETKSDSKEPEYSDAQLKTAMRKAMEDGDSDLVWDIMNFKTKQVKKELIKAYEDEKQQGKAREQAIMSEWKQVTNAYSKYADTKIPEIYPNSHKELNIADSTSLLYNVAMALYWSDDAERAAYYRQPGGQKLAVADALTTIISRKGGKKVKDSEKTLLRKKLLKAKRKKNVVSGRGSSGEEDHAAEPQTDGDILDEVIKDRRKFHKERGA